SQVTRPRGAGLGEAQVSGLEISPLLGCRAHRAPTGPDRLVADNSVDFFIPPSGTCAASAAYPAVACLLKFAARCSTPPRRHRGRRGCPPQANVPIYADAADFLE